MVNDRWMACRVMSLLIAREWRLIKGEFLANLLDTLIWPSAIVITFGYVVPATLAVGTGYGSFIFVAAIVTLCLIIGVHEAADLVTDITDNRMIEYLVTLPMSFRMLCATYIMRVFMRSIILNTPMMLCGTALLWQRFSFEHTSWFWVVVIYVWVNLAFSTFSLLIAAKVPYRGAFYHVWMRLLNPLLWLGCQFTTWQQAYAFSSWYGYAMLANPVTYMMEGLRAALFGRAGYLPLPLSLFMLILTTIIFFFVGSRSLKKRLDAV